MVTGAQGNLGKAVIRVFSAQHWQVYPMSRIKFMTWNNIRNAAWPEKLDLVVFAHGLQIPAMLTELTQINYNAIMWANLTSCVALTQTLLIREVLNPNALLVFCSSIQARSPRSSRGAYAIAKAGLESLARVVAAEHSPHIRTVVLRLGHLEHPMAGVEVDPEYIARRAPLGLIEERKVAEFIMSLYNSSGITGSVIDLDAGHLHNIW